MDHLVRDVRFAVRALLARPGFTAVAVIALALGIGANTAIFSVVNALLLRPFSFPDLDQLVTVWESRPEQRFGRFFVTPGDFLDWRRDNQVFVHTVGYRLWTANLTGAGEPEQIRACRVSPDFFRALGVQPQAGRLFSPDEEQVGRDDVAILSHGLWQRRYGGNRAVVGSTVMLEGRQFTIVGILPPNSEYPPRVELWLPLALTPSEYVQRDVQSLGVIARLRPGVTLPQAEADLNTIAARLARLYPATNAGRTTRIHLLRDYSADISKPFLLVLQIAAAFVLLIACANVMNLLLTRAIERRKEVAVRLALGASRPRIVRQMLTENLLLSSLGATLALLLAHWALIVIRNSAPPERAIAGWQQIELDLHALVFTIVVGVASCLVFGIAPALQAAKPRVVDDLKEGGRGAGAGVGRRVLRNALVAGEVALALALLVGASLVVKGIGDILNAYDGFNPRRVLTLRITASESKFERPADVAAFYEQLLDGIGDLPDTRGAGAIAWLPASFRFIVQSFDIERRPAATPRDRPVADVQIASPGYFRAMQIPVVHGRVFTESDGEQNEGVAVISESMARRYWPDQNPLGAKIRLSAGDAWLTIVGVVADVRNWFDREPQPTIYQCLLQSPVRSMSLTVRTAGDPMQSVAAVRNQIQRLDPDLPVTEIRTLEDAIAVATAELWIAATWIMALGGVALILSAVGIYGVMSYAVSQRAHEVGVRLALGARPNQVVGLIVADGSKLAAAGILVGLGIAWVLARSMTRWLTVVTADPLTFVLFTVLLAAVALLSSYMPARKAATIDPLTSLRVQ